MDGTIDLAPEVKYYYQNEPVHFTIEKSGRKPMKKFLALTALALLIGSTAPGFAQWKPAKPVRLVITFGAGGTMDGLGRLIAKKIKEQKDWNIVVENKGGASGLLGLLDVKGSAADGYTVGMSSTGQFALDPHLVKDARAKAGDFDYLGTAGVIEYALVVGKDAPFNDLKSMAEWSRKNQPVRFSVTGKALELIMERLSQQFDFKYVASPTSGSAQSFQLVLGGHADVTLSGGLHVPYVQSGEVKAIGVTGEKQADYAPNAKTIKQQGSDFSATNYFLFFVPKGMPAEIKDTLAKVIDDAVQSEEVVAMMKRQYNPHVNLGQKGAVNAIVEEEKMWLKLLSTSKTMKKESD
jgi:tripartite-type tricarboxylate transporter receptor subunit TctC